MSVFNVLPSIFKGKPIRMGWKGGRPLWLAADVCAILGIRRVDSAVGRLPDRQRGTLTVGTPGGKQEARAVTEAGIYKLAFRSRKPEAQEFVDWVCEDVLPTLRATGEYVARDMERAQEIDLSLDLEETRSVLRNALYVNRRAAFRRMAYLSAKYHPVVNVVALEQRARDAQRIAKRDENRLEWAAKNKGGPLTLEEKFKVIGPPRSNGNGPDGVG